MMFAEVVAEVVVLDFGSCFFGILDIFGISWHFLTCLENCFSENVFIL